MPDHELSSLRPQLITARSEAAEAAAALPRLRKNAATAGGSAARAQQQADELRAALDRLRVAQLQSPRIRILEQQLAAARMALTAAQRAAGAARLALQSAVQRDASARAA